MHSSALRSLFAVSFLFFWCVAVSGALAEASVTTLEHGAWPLAVAALQSDTHSEGTSVSVCVHDEGSESCAPCASYALTFDEIGSAAFTLGACDARTGATRVTLRDRSALFDHAHVVPRPRTVTIQAAVVHSFATTGGAAVTGGSTLGCTARVRPFLHDLEHGTDVPLGPDRFHVVVRHAAVAVSAVGDGWMFVSEERISSSVDYDVVEIASGEVVMTGHASLECASETDTDTRGTVAIDRSGPWIEAQTAGAHQRISVHFGNLPTSGSPWIGISPAGSESTRYLSYVYTGTQPEGSVELEGVAPGSYEIRAYRDSGYTVIATSTLVVGGLTPSGLPAALHVVPTRSNQEIDVEYANLPSTAWIVVSVPGSAADSYFRYQYATEGTGTVHMEGVAAGRYEVRAWADASQTVIATAELLVADSLDPACVTATPVVRATHFALPADGTTARSLRFTVTTSMQVAIDAHSVSRLELWSACGTADRQLAHNRQVDIGVGHARISVATLSAGIYELRVRADADADASIDVTPHHVPMIVDVQAGAVLGYASGMVGVGARGEVDFRFELGTSDMISGGIGLEVSSERYQCDGAFGAHGCGGGTSAGLSMDVYSVALPAFMDVGPPRDLAAFRFRVQLSPGLLITQGQLGGLAFSQVTPTLSTLGGFDIDVGPLTIVARAGVRFTSVTDGPLEVLGIGFVGSAGLALTF